MKNKFAIIASGGGMACAYSAGSIIALVDKYHLTNPDIVIGCSGGAGTLGYFVAGQYGSIKNIWTNLLSNKKFINYWRFWKVIDIDYLIDEVFKKQDSLNTAAILTSPINFIIPYTNGLTGKIEYFANTSGGNIFEALRATKAMPLVYRKLVQINNSFYCDTYLSSSIPLRIEKAQDMGANKILVLDNCSYNPIMSIGLRLWLNARTKAFKDNYYSEYEKTRSIKQADLFYIQPKGRLKITTLNNNASLLRETVNLGYNDTINNKNLEQFMRRIRNR